MDIIFSYLWAMLAGVSFGLWQHSFRAGLFIWALSVSLSHPWRKS
jgi:hypothetical protein